jgi:hypothetical protein
VRRLLARARSLWNTLAHKDRLDRDLDEELEGAVETLARRHVADGMDPAAARRDVLREGFGFASAGCAAGLAGAFVAGRLLQSQLYEVHPHDPIAVGTALGVILAGALAACAVPAYRAATVSPMDALRSE